MRLFATILLLVLGGQLAAQELNYNYIQGSYGRTDLDAGDYDVDGDGFGLYGSIEVGDIWHVFANFTSSSLDRNVDYDQVWIGGGLHTTLAPNASLYLNLAYINVDASSVAGPLDGDGLGTALGVRFMLMPQVEVGGAISYTDLGSAGSSTGIDGEGWYYFTRNFAAGVGLGFADDVIRYGIGARYYFR